MPKHLSFTTCVCVIQGLSVNNHYRSVILCRKDLLEKWFIGKVVYWKSGLLEGGNLYNQGSKGFSQLTTH